MRVKLPRQCSGQEILEAFKAAATFQERPDKRWEPRETIGEIQYEPGSVRQVVHSVGIRVWPVVLTRRWGLFGEKVWRRLIPNPTIFSMNPLIPSDRYVEIEVAVMNANIDISFAPPGYTTVDPRGFEFQRVRPQFEGMLGRFYALLQSAQA